MSLKAFHVVFITAASLLAFGFGAWLIHAYRSPEGNRNDLIWAVCSIAVGIALLVYERYALKKLKNESYL
jgi:choline-glycine betaine transporter